MMEFSSEIQSESVVLRSNYGIASSMAFLSFFPLIWTKGFQSFDGDQ